MFYLNEANNKQHTVDQLRKNLKLKSFERTISNQRKGETKDLRLIENDNIYQIKYLNEIPKDKELLKIINENKVILLKTESLKIRQNN